MYLFGEHVPQQLIEKMFGIKQVDEDASQFILTTSGTEFNHSINVSHICLTSTTATAPANEVEAIVQSPTNMAAAKIAAVDRRNAADFNKMMSLYHSTGGLLAAMFVGEDLQAKCFNLSCNIADNKSDYLVKIET